MFILLNYSIYDVISVINRDTLNHNKRSVSFNRKQTLLYNSCLNELPVHGFLLVRELQKDEAQGKEDGKQGNSNVD